MKQRNTQNTHCVSLFAFCNRTQPKERLQADRSIRMSHRNPRTAACVVCPRLMYRWDIQGSALKADGVIGKVTAGLKIILPSLVSTTSPWMNGAACIIHHKGNRVDKETSQDMQILIHCPVAHNTLTRLLNSLCFAKHYSPRVRNELGLRAQMPTKLQKHPILRIKLKRLWLLYIQELLYFVNLLSNINSQTSSEWKWFWID